MSVSVFVVVVVGIEVKRNGCIGRLYGKPFTTAFRTCNGVIELNSTDVARLANTCAFWKVPVGVTVEYRRRRSAAETRKEKGGSCITLWL